MSLQSGLKTEIASISLPGSETLVVPLFAWLKLIFSFPLLLSFCFFFFWFLFFITFLCRKKEVRRCSRACNYAFNSNRLVKLAENRMELL